MLPTLPNGSFAISFNTISSEQTVNLDDIILLTHPPSVCTIAIQTIYVQVFGNFFKGCHPIGMDLKYIDCPVTHFQLIK